MPCYQLVLLARPEVTPERLAVLFRTIARVVYREQGQFRSVENFGVRPLSYPIRDFGQRFDEARWVHAVYDCAPAALAAVRSAISTEKGVLQFKFLKAAHPLARFNASGRKEKLKRFSTAMRFNSALFDPETLTVAQPGAGPAAAALR